MGPAAPPSLNLVSNTSQNGNSDNQFSNQAHAQAFTTGSERNGYILSKVTIISEDEEEDDIALSVCEVDGNTHPTETCTDLIPPTLFEMGSLVFSAPRDRPVTLKPGTTYSVVFNSPGGQDVKLDATDGDGEDTSSLGGWSIRNRSQLQSNNQWANRGYDRAMLIAITGRLSPNEAPEGIPAITGIHAAGQTLTASTESITDPDGVPTGLTYQWKRYASDNVFEDNIGANLPTHTLTAADEGKKIRVEVSYIDNQGYIEGPLASPLSAVIGAAPLISNTSPNGQVHHAGLHTPGPRHLRPGPKPTVTPFPESPSSMKTRTASRWDLRICGASGDGIPNQECVTLSRPTTFSPGALNYTPPKGETIQLDGEHHPCGPARVAQRRAGAASHDRTTTQRGRHDQQRRGPADIFRLVHQKHPHAEQPQLAGRVIRGIHEDGHPRRRHEKQRGRQAHRPSPERRERDIP